MKKKQLNTEDTLFNCMTKQDKAKDYRLRKRYGISLVDYNRLLKKQKGKCAICGKDNDDTAHGLVVDHNHRTGHVRGLLCTYCNRRVVGRVGDDFKRMKGFIKYIERQFKEDKDWK